MRLVAAELLKLRRWSTYILVLIGPLFQLLVMYLLISFAIRSAPEADAGGELFLSTLEPSNVVTIALTTGVSGLGGALALVLGALTSAREYGWRTVGLLLTQGPPRLAMFAAKLVALLLVVVMIVVLTFAASALGSVLVSESDASSFPPLADFGAGIAVGTLILSAWAGLGSALGFLLRSTGLAIGLGLVYALVVETLLVGLGAINDIFDTISRGLLGVNSSALAASFGPGEIAEEFGVQVIDPPIAAAVLGAYLAVSLVAAGAVLVRRDVT